MSATIGSMNASGGKAPPLVRVFLPTYRRPGMLARALLSLRAQTMRDWVCEVHNDDPLDSSPATLVGGLSDTRFQVVTHPANLGGTRTFNLFFGEVREPYTSILEDDNWWDEDFLATMLETASAHPEVDIFWSNMRIWMEGPAGEFSDSGRLVQPRDSAVEPELFRWGRDEHILGALHSNGSALYRRRCNVSLCTPEVPFGVIEPFRERMFTFPIAHIARPLANFSVTLQSERSKDRGEWAVTQTMLGATFLKHCGWKASELDRVMRIFRQRQPPSTTPLLLAGLVDPRCRRILRHTRTADWWVLGRGLLRRPSVWRRVMASRRRHAPWWDFLEFHTAKRFSEEELRARGPFSCEAPVGIAEQGRSGSR
jgi:hypothetical protein